VLMHADGTYESGYWWQYEGNVAPSYGAFAEGYVGIAQVDSIVLDVSTWPSAYPYPADIYLWGDDGGTPGAVLALLENVFLGAAVWPIVERNVIGLAEPVCVGDAWWAGYWGHWPGSFAEFFIGADLNGPGGGSSMTNVAPGQDFPSGWQDVDVVWGPTAALGIGAVVEECPTPAEGQSWGSIKALYR